MANIMLVVIICIFVAVIGIMISIANGYGELGTAVLKGVWGWLN